MARQLVIGNQGRNHQLGAHQGNSRGCERIAYQDLPSIHEIENTLEQLTASITLKTEGIPRRPLTLPLVINDLSEIDIYSEMARLDLQYDDLKTDKPRTASLNRLCKALCIGRYTTLCLCSSDCIANNQESLHFLRICAPKSLRQQYAEADYLPDARNAISIGKKYGNSHTVYYSPVSVCGTVTPQMICRQPISELTRRSECHNIATSICLTTST
jgi:hypothetical protein